MYPCSNAAHTDITLYPGAGAGAATSRGGDQRAPQLPTVGSRFHAAAPATQQIGTNCTSCVSSLLGCISVHSDCTAIVSDTVSYSNAAHTDSTFCVGAGAGAVISRGSNQRAPQLPTAGRSTPAAAPTTQHTGIDCIACESSLVGCISVHSGCTSHSKLCILIDMLLAL
jgi:hypothetical protein